MWVLIALVLGDCIIVTFNLEVAQRDTTARGQTGKQRNGRTL